MKYLSVCSGIEAATVAWHHLGWKPVGFAEIEKFPQQVLAHHYPDVPNFQDLTQHDKWPLERGAVDLLVGGTPCQAFSIAGLRRGMDDERGQLTLEFVRLAARLRPRWIVWENVPGVLSSGGGRDFGSFLGALAQLGYGFAYRVLDAQYFGVAQRRRRVFVVGYLGDWRCAAAVLFERESLRGDSSPRSKAQQETSSSARSGLASSGANVVGAIDCRVNAQRAQNAVAGHLIPAWPAIKGCTSVARSEESRGQDDVVIGTITARMFNALGVRDIESGALLAVASGRQSAAKWPAEIACTLNARYGDKQGLEDQHALGGASLFVPAVGTDCFNARQDPVQYGDQAGALDQDGYTMAVALGTDCYNGSVTGDVAATMGTPGSSVNASGPTVMVAQHAVAQPSMQVRRLTPVECERLQGFPDGYTDIRPRGKDTPDGPRYKALGNSMAVPVMRWIGERVNLVDSLKRSR